MPVVMQMARRAYRGMRFDPFPMIALLTGLDAVPMPELLVVQAQPVIDVRQIQADIVDGENGWLEFHPDRFIVIEDFFNASPASYDYGGPAPQRTKKVRYVADDESGRSIPDPSGKVGCGASYGTEAWVSKSTGKQQFLIPQNEKGEFNYSFECGCGANLRVFPNLTNYR